MEAQMHGLRLLGHANLPLPEAVYRSLRNEILSGIFRPGQVLRQEELARHFGISRAPLREALPRLEAEGLVVLRPRRGYAVVSLDPAEIAEIFELRMLVEERAAYLAASNRSREDIPRLAGLVAAMAEIELTEPVEVARWADLNFQFHDLLLAPSGRGHFHRVATSLRAAVEPYIRVELTMTGGPEEAQREHEQLLDAFAAGDAERCARLTREHCEHTARRLLEALREKASAREG